MENSSELLLIIVSATLTVFLLLAIVCLFYVISVLRKVKKLTDTAQNVALNVEAAAEAFERSAKPVAIIKVISNIVSQVMKSTNSKGRKK